MRAPTNHEHSRINPILMEIEYNLAREWPDKEMDANVQYWLTQRTASKNMLIAIYGPVWWIRLLDTAQKCLEKNPYRDIDGKFYPFQPITLQILRHAQPSTTAPEPSAPPTGSP